LSAKFGGALAQVLAGRIVSLLRERFNRMPASLYDLSISIIKIPQCARP
jgi:hypothetical protein